MEWNQIPRSIRQMGLPDRSCLVYMEEYAISYLRSLNTPGATGIRAGFLFGRKLRLDGQPCFYIFGAAEAPGVWQEERLHFRRSTWQQMETLQSEYFPAMEICGWFVRSETDFLPDPEALQRVQDTSFAEHGELLLTITGTREQFLRQGEQTLYPLQGYAIFYQSNTAMQDYMRRERTRPAPVIPPPSTTVPDPPAAPISPPSAPIPPPSDGIRRCVALLLFAALAASVVFYGHPERFEAVRTFLPLPSVTGSAAVSSSAETEESG